MSEHNNETCSSLAKKVMVLSRNQLLVNLRFLDVALSRLSFVENEDIPYATDGQFFVYAPRSVLRDYKNDRAVCTRNYLHIILHCVFRHMGTSENRVNKRKKPPEMATSRKEAKYVKNMALFTRI